MSGLAWAFLALVGLVAATLGSRRVSGHDRLLGKPGSVALQSARTPERVERLKSLWGPRLPDAVGALRWDFLLIVGYACLLVGLVGLTTPAVAGLVGVRDAIVFGVPAGVALLAALSDSAENLVTLRELARPATATTARMAVGFARTKVTLLGLAAAWLVLVAVPMALVRW